MRYVRRPFIMLRSNAVTEIRGLSVKLIVITIRFSLPFPQVAEMLGPGHVITTCLCDTGQVCDRSRDVS